MEKKYIKLSEIAKTRGDIPKTILGAFQRMKKSGELKEGVDYIQGTNSKNKPVWLVDPEAFERVYLTKEISKEKTITEQGFKEILEKLQVDISGEDVYKWEDQLNVRKGDIKYTLHIKSNNLYIWNKDTIILIVDLSPVRCKCNRIIKKI